MNKIFSLMMIIVMSLFVLDCGAKAEHADHIQFWNEFKKAAMKDDYFRLESLVRFPLEVLGVDDSMPARQITKEEFPDAFRPILEQEQYDLDGNTPAGKKVADIIAGTDEKDIEIMKNTFRVSQLEFEKIAGRWLLVRAYLE